MKAILKSIPWLLVLLTVLISTYLVALYFNHDKVFYYNEKYSFYVVIQVVHVLLTLSCLLIVWSNSKNDKWIKIDHSILVFCFSIIGIWIWYLRKFKEYKQSLTSIEDVYNDSFKE